MAPGAVFTALLAQADADEDLNWAVSVDSTIVRAISTRPGPEKRGPGRRTVRARPRPAWIWETVLMSGSPSRRGEPRRSNPPSGPPGLVRRCLRLGWSGRRAMLWSLTVGFVGPPAAPPVWSAVGSSVSPWAGEPGSPRG